MAWEIHHKSYRIETKYESAMVNIKNSGAYNPNQIEKAFRRETDRGKEQKEIIFKFEE